MQSGKEIQSQSAMGWIISLFFHLTVGILFLYIIIDTSIFVEEFAEVSFSSVIPADFQNPAMSRQQSAQPQRQNTDPSQQTRIVDLPKRTMLENQKPTILQDVKDKVTVPENTRVTGQRVDPLTGIARESQAKTGAQIVGERDTRGARKIDVGDKVTTDVQTEGLGGQGKIKKPYEIRWEGGDREILADPLPQFPEGIERDVVIKMQINVLPDGTMGNIVTLQKGNAVIESETNKALKKWRFNPLEPSAPQVSQKGVITFRFVLK
ncbi:hypothetical protein ACFL6L_04000 [candidate division KSB1 bacterium]